MFPRRAGLVRGDPSPTLQKQKFKVGYEDTLLKARGLNCKRRSRLAIKIHY